MDTTDNLHLLSGIFNVLDIKRNGGPPKSKKEYVLSAPILNLSNVVLKILNKTLYSQFHRQGYLLPFLLFLGTNIINLNNGFAAGSLKTLNQCDQIFNNSQGLPSTSQSPHPVYFKSDGQSIAGGIADSIKPSDIRLALKTQRSTLQRLPLEIMGSFLANFWGQIALLMNEQTIKTIKSQVSSASPNQIKLNLNFDPEKTLFHRRQTQKILADAKQSPQRIQEFLKPDSPVSSLIKITQDSGGNFIVSQNQIYLNNFKEDLNLEIALLVKKHFASIAHKTVDLIYQTSGLDPLHPESSGALLDDMVEVLRSSRGFETHLQFKKEVWELEVQWLNYWIESYVNATSLHEKRNIQKMIESGETFFLPSAGIVTTTHPFLNNHRIEYKRYFSNPFSDPLEFIKKQPNEFSGPQLEQINRYRLLIQVTKGLNEQSLIEVHAHTRQHVIYYRSQIGRAHV